MKLFNQFTKLMWQSIEEHNNAGCVWTNIFTLCPYLQSTLNQAKYET